MKVKLKVPLKQLKVLQVLPKLMAHRLMIKKLELKTPLLIRNMLNCILAVAVVWTTDIMVHDL